MEEHQIPTEMDRIPDGAADDFSRTLDNTNYDSSHPRNGDGASPGKIFIGGLARETTSAQFISHFGKYGEIIDSVIMKDRETGHPRGFGFVTYADSAVVDRVIEETHIFHGKQVEIKRTIPRGANLKDFKTKKIFVGGIPATISEDEFRDFFSNYGEVKEQQIMRDHSTGRSRGFGFVTFDSEQSVDDLLENGNRIEFAGVQVEIKKAEPKKPNHLPPPPSRRQSNSRASSYGRVGDTYGGFGGGGGYGDSSFGGGGGYGDSSFGGGSYRSGGAYASRLSAYGGYGGSDPSAYGGYGAGNYGALRPSDPSYGYSSRLGGGLGRGYNLGDEYGGLGDSYGGYGGGSGGYDGGYCGGYDGGYSGGYGGGGDGGGGYGDNSGGYGGSSRGSVYGSRGSYSGSGSGRYHPYGR